MSGWLTRHLQALLFAMGRQVRAPLATAFTVLVIAIALTLPTVFGLFITSLRTATGNFAEAVDLTVYLRQGTSLAKARQLEDAAKQRSGVAHVSLIAADDALKSFRNQSGFGAALDVLGENPLPHALIVRPSLEAASPGDMESLRKYLSAWPEVELVQVDSDWVIRLNAMLDLLRRLAMGIAILLGIGVLAVVGNTIRLEIQNRRAEIEVTKLVGGSDAFVRRPFLYTGFFYGLLGALLAVGLVSLGLWLLATPVATLAQSYGSAFRLQLPGWREIAALLGIGVVLGLVGAYAATARYLAKIEPRA
jgi:cell division transport system permease protein